MFVQIEIKRNIVKLQTLGVRRFEFGLWSFKLGAALLGFLGIFTFCTYGYLFLKQDFTLNMIDQPAFTPGIYISRVLQTELSSVYLMVCILMVWRVEGNMFPI